MKAKPTLFIVCLALAVLTIVGTMSAEAQCCRGDAVAAPPVTAGAVVEGAVVVSAAIVTAPFAGLSCGSCGFSACNPCGSPPVSDVPGDYGRY